MQIDPRPMVSQSQLPAEPKLDPDQRLVLFDGDCHFCNGAVLFIVDRDPNEHFLFAPLQSDLGQATLKKHGCADDIDSIVVVERGVAYTCSTAALRIARGLKWPWPVFFYLFTLVPRFVRDAAYRYFAKHRYQWFGRTDECRIPTPALRRRLVA